MVDRAPQPGADPPEPTLAPARRWLALERPDRALEEVDRLPSHVRSSGEGLLLRAAAFHDLGRHDEAVSVATRGLVEASPEPSLLAVLGSARRALGQLEQAERAYLDGLAIAPSHVGLLCAYAQLCLAVDQVDKAERLVERAAARDPQSARVARSRLLLGYVRTAAAEGSGEAPRRGPPEGAGMPTAGGGRTTNLPEGGWGDAAGDRDLRGGPPDGTPVGGRELGGSSEGTPVGGRDLKGGYQALRRAVKGRRGAGTDLGEPELGFVAHPLMRPLRPVIRVGPLKVFLGVAAGVVLTVVLRWYTVTAVLLVGWLALCAYALLVPPIARLLARRPG